MKKTILALAVTLSFIFLYTSCSYAIISGSAQSKNADETGSDVINLIPASPVEAEEKRPPEKVAELPEDDGALKIKPEYIDALKRNKELIGRIYIENTNIDQYVFFTDNNDYYLSHNMEGNEDKYGSVFMDQINHGVLLDKNVILHGHNFNDGYMFYELVKYKKQDFYEQNKTIHFNTLYHDYTWEVFAAYTTTEADYYIKTSFKTDEEFYDYVDYVIDRSLIDSDYKPAKTDTLLTLHTCSYEFKDAHTIICAYLKEKK